MTRPRSTSVRTCLGCRERSSPDGLLRVVAVDGIVIPDPTATRGGRGAWLHPGCLEAAERRKAFTRALRVASGLDLGPLRDYLASTPNRAATVAARRTDGHREDEPPMSTQP